MALFSLQQSEAFANLSFVGGTALRFLFGLPRFSEDLDFSLESPDGYDPVKWLRKLKRDLEFMGFAAEVTWNDKRAVHTGSLKLGGLLQEAGLGIAPTQKLSIKLEIDSQPPGGARTEVKVVRLHRMLAVRHHTLPCLMAGKIRAILTRHSAKGRDWYDLLWYVSRIPPTTPDLEFLQSCLDQGSRVKPSEAGNWKNLLAAKLEKLDMKALGKDASPFLERRNEAEFLNREYLLHALKTLP